MYCSQCGKKVNDTMLFCPFCGSPIVIPEQDDEVLTPVQTVNTAFDSDETVQVQPVYEPSSAISEEEPVQFIPLDMENPVWNEPILPENSFSFDDPSPQYEENDESFFAQAQVHSEEPVRLEGHMPDLSASRAMKGEQTKRSSGRSADTRVPQRQFNPDDIFMDGGDSGYEEDDYYDDDEHEESSFFIRHIRGLVSLGLLLIVVLIVAGWACTGSGQRALARAGMAWSPSVYAEIAYETYQTGSYSAAGSYYSKALSRDRDNYDYANSAGVSYYMANDVLKAESMARKAIEIDASRTEAYQLLLRLYPDEALRPVEVQSLLLSGYQLTGDSSLNVGQKTE